MIEKEAIREVVEPKIKDLEGFLVDVKVNTGFMKAGTVNRITSIEEHGNEKKEYNFELNNRAIVLSFAYLF